MIHDNYITNYIILQDKNLKVTNIQEIDNTLYVFVEFESIHENICCPKCGNTNFHKHGYYTRQIKHIKFGNKQSFIILKQTRLLCLNCNKTYTVDTSLIDYRRRISNQLSLNTLKACSKKQSFKDVSEDSNISETTVINEFKKQIHEYRCELTEVICIDEFKASTIAGTYALIIGDPISGVILDILPARNQDYLLFYFQSIKNEEILKVKYIITDLFEPYRSIVHSCFSNAIHIADRFHWIRLATEAFNKQRIKTMNFYLNNKSSNLNSETIKNYIDYAHLLKSNYKLLLSNRTSHESWYYDQIVKKDKYGREITMNNIIEQCINQDTDLEEAYHLLQELYSIAKYSNEFTIKQSLEKWCEKVLESDYIIAEFKKTALTYKSWMNEIVNSFILNPITHKRMSNGFMEGKNNFCKTIKRIGFGYKDFDLFRNRIININKKTLK